MEKIKVNKLNLLEVLNKNRNQHIEDYKLAVEGYKILSKKALQKKLKELKNLNDENYNEFSLYFSHIEKPVSHEDDFDTVIGMLNITIETDINISASEYKQYYLNEWQWKRDWYFSNTGYMGAAGSAGISGSAGIKGSTSKK